MYDLIDCLLTNKTVSFNIWLFQVLMFLSKAVDKFCLVADSSTKVPKLKKKKYYDFKISLDEWEILSLTHEVLKVFSSIYYTCLIL